MSPIPASPQVWLCPLADSAWNPAEVEGWLDDHELERYRAFGHPLAANRFLLGRGILKSTLSRLAGVHPADIKLAYSANGKPFLAGEGQPCFSISHCADAVAVAVAPFAIGMDLEDIQRPRQPWKRPELFLHPKEAERIRVLPLEEQAQVFAVRWTCQEAGIKLLDSSVFNAGSRILFDEPACTGACDGHRLRFTSWAVCAHTGTGVPIETSRGARSGVILSLAGFSGFVTVEFNRWVS